MLKTNTLIIRTTSAAFLMFIASGTCLAQKSSTGHAPTTITLSQSQIQSIRAAYNWLDRDSSITSSRAITPTTIFVESPGLKERTDYLNVKVKSQTQMVEQITRDAIRTSINAPHAQTRGAAITQTQQATTLEFNQRITLAQQRMVEARARLAPSLREAYDDIDMHSVKLPIGVSAELAAEALMQTGDYEYVSIDWLCYPTDTTPNDSLFGTQWHHAFNRIDSVGAWDFTQGSSGTIIGVCDSGVDIDHPDLAAALVPGYNTTDNLAQVDGGVVNDHTVGHGTLVAGSAAAIGNNGTGVSGVGWNFGIMPIKVSNNSSGTALISEILEGARWASDNGAYTANCSFGGAEDPATRTSGGHIRLEGHLLVFAAGNDGLANQVNDWAKVTIVGASNQSDNWASWSHTGVGIDCIAPGTSIRTTTRTGGYTFTTGTSFSAPITAGALMLVHDANPSLSADEVEFILLNSCDDKQAVGQDDQTGWGRINVGRAVEDAIFGPSTIDLPFEDDFSNDLSMQWRNPIGDVSISSEIGSLSLNLDDSDSIETIAIRTAILAGNPGEIELLYQHRGVEAGETLTVEYLNVLSNWETIATLVSDGTNQTEFTQFRVAIPVLGMHNGFKLRLAANGSDSTDDWYIDSVGVRAFVHNELPWEESFEDGITLTLDWASSNASVSSDAINEPDGTQSALLNNQDTMTSADVDVSTAPSSVYIHFSTEHNSVEENEALLVEYKTLLGVWKTLTTIVSDGDDQSAFDFTQIPLPFDAYGATTAIRFTAQGDESDDSWFVDSIAITTEFIDESCPADFTGDGELNFFDVSLFLQGFSAGDDYNGDGLTNFFDVSAFLGDFSAGCP